MKKSNYRLVTFLLLMLVVCSFSSCYVGRFFWWNFADINDYKKFQYMKVRKEGEPFVFNKSKGGMPFDTIRYNGALYNFDDFVKYNRSVAFLVIRNDTVLYEKYFMGRNEASYVPSFSAAKSFVSALVGIAINEGYIKSVDQPITDYLPELKKNDERFAKITIEHLLNMRSGISFTEGYFNPFGNVAKSYYGRNLLSQLKKLKIKEDPDKNFNYVSINAQLLGFIVERATGKKLPDYLQEKIWKPLGMEYDATWSIDSRKHKEAKAFCCLNAVARDFAKFGRLYLHKGNWNGKQIIPAEWVTKSTVITNENKNFFYSYQWWHNVNWSRVDNTSNLKPEGTSKIITDTRKGITRKYMISPANDFFADGLLGQYIYVYPEKNVIIIRLGKHANVNWAQVFYRIAKQL